MNNCLSYWYPKLLAAGLPVPRTEIVQMSDEAYHAIWKVFDGEPLGEEAKPFFDSLRAACDRMGYPCFLRTGQTSNKHEWKDTCHLRDGDALQSHVVRLVEFSECCDFMGLPWDQWCVRELLPTKPIAILPHYGDMPLVREYRFFVMDGKIECAHPYWPADAVAYGFTDGAIPPDVLPLYEAMCVIPSDDDFKEQRTLVERAGAAVGGHWSVDILETTRGWYVTDMAIAERSFHWPECSKGQ